MSSHHRKKTYAFKCELCQEVFENKELFRTHTSTVDCDICCPECDQKFEKKAMRLSHQEIMHPEGGKSVLYKELDDTVWRRLKDELKAFQDLIRRGAPLDPGLEKWVVKNTERWQKGRARSANPTVELGQWYIAWGVLNLQGNIPDHPCKFPTT